MQLERGFAAGSAWKERRGLLQLGEIARPCAGGAAAWLLYDCAVVFSMWYAAAACVAMQGGCKLMENCTPLRGCSARTDFRQSRDTRAHCSLAHNQQRARKFLRISSTHSAILNTRGVKKRQQEGASRGCRGRPRWLLHAHANRGAAAGHARSRQQPTRPSATPFLNYMHTRLNARKGALINLRAERFSNAAVWKQFFLTFLRRVVLN